MSDHGFGPLKGKFCINRWLEELGLLSYDPVKIKRFRLKTKIVPLLRQIVKKADPLNLRKKLTARITKNPERMGAYSFLDCIDWSKTVAYAASNTEQGIYINLEGREPSGIVKPGKDWDEERNLVINRLRDIRNPQTNERLVSRIYKREDIYSGPYVNNAPDIIFFLKEGEYLADVQPMNYLFEKTSWKTGTGTHRMEGIFVGYGKDIKAGLRIADAEIIDLAPTILNLMGVRIPDDMDGKVLTHIFTDDFLKDNPPQYVEGADSVTCDDQGDGVYSDQEAAELEAQLKGLGYL
jgi:predicted AlkP superfamily phosphohydrolase/phosphomutase